MFALLVESRTQSQNEKLWKENETMTGQDIKKKMHVEMWTQFAELYKQTITFNIGKLVN